MSQPNFDLERYLTAGAEDIVKDLLKAAILHPREGKFAAQFAVASARANALRHDYERKGVHIPSFLICSITSRCNLHCAGCYARSLELCGDGPVTGQLSAGEWKRVFVEARALGVGFILLAGGEPMVRKDVLEVAAEVPELLFPIFTNGTLISGEYFDLLDQHRNLVPVFSMEGGEASTDARRGSGVFHLVTDAMRRLRERRILFGASVTVTTENADEVLSDAFLSQLRDAGCKVVFYVEYVPTDGAKSALAPDDACREKIAARVSSLREAGEMLYISFPGDEVASGGCLAAGRGFFHINPYGGAEPCPFSPYSDINIRDSTLLDAMNSELFRSLRDGGLLEETHTGGCVLYEQREKVAALTKEG